MNINDKTKIIEIKKDSRDVFLDELVLLWQGSVRKANSFLSKEDILSIKPDIYRELRQLEHLIVVLKNRKLVAFMGIEVNKIELLFIDANHQRLGYGRMLIKYAKRFRVKYVDVNEDNINAVDFYTHLGFETYKISPCDDRGNPLRVLKMKKD